MYHKSFFTYGTEEPSSYTQDWVEAVGSLAAPNHTLTGLEDAPATPSPFGEDEDESVRSMYAAIAPLEPSTADEWQHPDHDDMFSSVPGFMNDAATTLYSTSPAPSPASSTTLFDSPFALSAEVDSPWGGDALVAQPAAYSPAAFQGFGSTFPSGPMPTMPAFDPSSLPFHQQTFCNGLFAYDEGQYGLGQQPSQHKIGAAGVVAPNLIMSMEVNTDAPALTSMYPISFSPPFISFSEPQQEFVVAGRLQLTTTARNNQPLLNIKAEPTVPQGSNDEVAESPKKKRKQSTEKRYACDYPGCTATSARSHNLKVHKDSVHLKLRRNVCDAPGCGRAFSRSHDLMRHKISAHTNFGSPRNPNNVKAAKGVIARSRATVKRMKLRAREV